MLIIEINHIQRTIPLNEVQYVDYVENLTPLPFAASPIEGLSLFNYKPILQINLAQAFGFDNQVGDKRVIITTSQGDIALRVDAILGFVNQDSVEKPPPLLELQGILAMCKKVTQTIQLNPPPTIVTPPPAPLNVLLVTAGGETVALLSHTIDHIEEIADFQQLEYNEQQPDLLIKIKNDLLPAYSLSRFLKNAKERIQKKAVIVQGSRNLWALVVEQVLSLENIHQVYTTGTDTHALWYIANTGDIREIIDANQLIGETSHAVTMPITQPQWGQSFVKISEKFSNDGLQIECDNNRYVLPMTIVQSSLDELDRLSLTRRRFPIPKARCDPKTRLPWISATLLLTGKSHPISTPKSTVLITFSQHSYILLGVDRALLQPIAPDAWFPLTYLPFPTVLFFDAATYDEGTGQWILRVKEYLEFSKLPWAIKKAIVTATIGWLDLETITNDSH